MEQIVKEKRSFSQRIKEELLSLPLSKEEARLVLAFSLMSAAKLSHQGVRFALAFRPYVNYLKALIEEQFAFSLIVQVGKGISSFEISNPDQVQAVRNWLSEEFTLELSRGRTSLAVDDFSDEEKRIILRALYLSGGSLTEPSKMYHLEFSIKRVSVAEFYKSLIESYQLTVGLIKRYGYNVLYLKDADHISTLLGLMSASTAVLHFEAKRVDKEVNNSVNRMVNCDQANARRIANSSARQMDLLQELKNKKGFSFLPEELRETAELRLAYPGHSLAELGGMLTQIVGKSGMHHRLKKLEMIAKESLCL